MNDHLGIQISVHYVLTKDKNLSATEREIKKKKKFAKQPKQQDTSESYRSNNEGGTYKLTDINSISWKTEFEEFFRGQIITWKWET